MHQLTKSGVALNVHLEDFEGQSREANYSSFKVAGASDKYRMVVSGITHLMTAMAGLSAAISCGTRVTSVGDESMEVDKLY